MTKNEAEHCVDGKGHIFYEGVFRISRGLVQTCTKCGLKRTLRYRPAQPTNEPGTKVRKSKKERRRERESRAD